MVAVKSIDITILGLLIKASSNKHKNKLGHNIKAHNYIRPTNKGFF